MKEFWNAVCIDGKWCVCWYADDSMVGLYDKQCFCSYSSTFINDEKHPSIITASFNSASREGIAKFASLLEASIFAALMNVRSGVWDEYKGLDYCKLAKIQEVI